MKKRRDGNDVRALVIVGNWSPAQRNDYVRLSKVVDKIYPFKLIDDPRGYVLWFQNFDLRPLLKIVDYPVSPITTDIPDGAILLCDKMNPREITQCYDRIHREAGIIRSRIWMVRHRRTHGQVLEGTDSRAG